MMRRFTSYVVVGLLLGAGPAFAQEAKAKATTPEIPYDSVSFLKMPADGSVYMGEGIGVATSSKGQVYVITRSGESRVFEFDPQGNFVKEFGKESYGYGFAHAVRVDKDDNVWSVDEGSNVILKYNPAGKLLMVLGKRPDPLDQIVSMPGGAPFSGANRPYSFHRPTDIAWDPQGNIFVSDGYINHRVVKYDRDGRFIRQVGSEMRGTEPYQFNTPHTIASDAQGNVYVGDRNNGRIQVFDNNLVLRAIYDHVGRPWEICISPGPHQYLFVSNSNRDNNNVQSWNTAGEIYKMELDGQVLGKFGTVGKAVGQFQTVHGIDCRNPDELVVSEITAWRVQKIRLGEAAPTSDAR
jgi:DNA-binding beta-propeller fold protein YncE